MARSAAVARQDALEESRPRRYLVEALATAVYVLIGAGAESVTRITAARSHRVTTATDWVTIALAHGLALATITIFARRFSGAHINPAVTIGLATLRRFAWRDVAPQLIAQFLGGVVGAAAVLVVFGKDAASIGLLGAPVLAPGVSLAQGGVIEGLGAGILAMTIAATGRDPRAPLGWASLAAGMSVAAVTMFLGPATTSLINPARAFGPDLLGSMIGLGTDWAAYAVCYLVGPMLGAIGGCQLYSALSLLSSQQAATGQRGRS